MRLTRRIVRTMLMTMMFIVDVTVVMLHRFVDMLVFVTLCEVKP